MGLKPHLVVRKKFPLVQNDAFDARITVLKTSCLCLSHSVGACRTFNHITLDLQLLQVVQVLIQLELLLAFKNHELDQGEHCVGLQF